MGQLEEDNKELARRMIAALTKADVDFIKEYYAENFWIWVAGSLPFIGTGDKASAVAGMPAVLSLFPSGLRFSTVAMTAEGDRVAIEATSVGTTALGREYSQSYHFLMRVRDGKIVGWKEYMDTEHARKELGGDE
jgi:ketosteroid isomerase-like protein